jgi:hypothetical protein
MDSSHEALVVLFAPDGTGEVFDIDVVPDHRLGHPLRHTPVITTGDH